MWDKEVDVLCVGSGGGGFSAAIKSADMGAKVLIVEKDSVVGGVTGLSSGQLWVGANHLQKRSNIIDSKKETKKYLSHLSQGFADPILQENFIDKSIEVVRYFSEDVGIKFKIIPDLPDYYYPVVEGSKAEGRFLEVEPFPAGKLGEWAAKCIVSPYSKYHAYTMGSEWTAFQTGKDKMLFENIKRHADNDERCVGEGLACYLLEAALARNVEIWTSSAAIKLILDDEPAGSVAGAVINTAEGEIRVKVRKGVVLATSGYDWNEEYVKAFEALTVSGSMCPPTVEGDHIVMAAEAGALPMPSRAPAQTPVFIGYHVPSEKIYNKPTFRLLLPGRPHSIIVNRAGKRFADDSFYPDVATRVARFDGQSEGMPNWPAWLIVDDNFRIKYGLAPSSAGDAFPEGMAISAASLEELAAEVGIESTTFLETVLDFNRSCLTGVDNSFGRGSMPWGVMMNGDADIKPNPTMAPLSLAPFYAIPLARVVMGVPTTGLNVNKDSQVLNSRGLPIPKLYAAGNSTTWSDIGGGYNSGISNTRGLLQGYLAAISLMS